MAASSLRSLLSLIALLAWSPAHAHTADRSDKLVKGECVLLTVCWTLICASIYKLLLLLHALSAHEAQSTLHNARLKQAA